MILERYRDGLLSLRINQKLFFSYSFDLRFLTQRGPVKQSKAKIVVEVHSHEAGEGIPNLTITDFENRLLEAALMPIKTPAKL